MWGKVGGCNVSSATPRINQQLRATNKSTAGVQVTGGGKNQPTVNNGTESRMFMRRVRVVITGAVVNKCARNAGNRGNQTNNRNAKRRAGNCRNQR